MLPPSPLTAVVGPLTAVLVDPSNLAHVEELTRQRILCGWAAELVPPWLDSIHAGTRLQYIYYETSTNLPIGGSALNTLEQYGARTLGSLPTSQIGIRSTSIDPAFRGKSFGKYVFEHMHAVGFSNPEVEEIVLDVMTSNSGMLAWVKRMGYVETDILPCFDEGKVAAHMVAAEPEGGYKVIYSALTRERWATMLDMKSKGIRLPEEVVKNGAGAFPPMPMKYSEEQAQKVMKDNLKFVENTDWKKNTKEVLITT